MTNDALTLAYEVADALDKSWDIPFIRRMEESVYAYRASVYKQEFDKNGRFPPGGEDSIVLEMQKVPTHECLDEDLNCTVTRTIYKVPKAVRKGRSAIPYAFVGSVNQEYPFMYTRPEEVKSFLLGTKFIKDKTLYANLNDYIYTFNHDAGKIAVRDVFSDPRQLLTLLNCDKKPCRTDITIDGDMKRTIKMMIFEEIRQFNRLPEDQSVKLNEGNV